MAKGVKQQAREFLIKLTSTEKLYDESAEKRHIELMEASSDLEEAEKELEVRQKQVILNTIKEDEYKIDETNGKVLKDKVIRLQSEVKAIEIYKMQDIEEVLEEINDIKPALNRKVQEEINTIKKEVETAKFNYLMTLHEVKKKYKKTIEERSLIEGVQIRLGKQNYSYIPSAAETLSLSAAIQPGELEEVLRGKDAPANPNH